MATSIFRILPVKLTEEERRAKADELVAAMKKRGEVVDIAKADAAAAKAEVKEIEASIASLGEQVRTRTEHRDVECYEETDRKRNLVGLIRLDTGELVSQRPLTTDERQVVMFPGLSSAKSAIIEDVVDDLIEEHGAERVEDAIETIEKHGTARVEAALAAVAKPKLAARRVKKPKSSKATA